MVRIILPLTLLATLVAAAVWAQGAASPSGAAPLPPEPAAITEAKAQGLLLIRDPDWLISSIIQGDMANFPDRALRLERGGNVRLRCQIGAAGKITRCSVLDESPSGLGFGAYAVDDSRRYVTAPERIHVANPEDGQALEISTAGIVVEFTYSFIIDGYAGPATVRPGGR